jgi:hypothetical protein
MSELFNGKWAIDLERSKVWNDRAERYVADAVGDEIVTLHIEDGVQDYEVLYGDRPVIRMGYTSRYDDPTWVPYLVRSISGVGDGEREQAVSEFKHRINASDGERERQFEVGREYGLVRTVYVDERTHYRISKSAEDGSAQSVLLRRIAEDGATYVATVLDVNGIVFRIRHFVRADGV